MLSSRHLVISLPPTPHFHRRKGANRKTEKCRSRKFEIPSDQGLRFGSSSESIRGLDDNEFANGASGVDDCGRLAAEQHIHCPSSPALSCHAQTLALPCLIKRQTQTSCCRTSALKFTPPTAINKFWREGSHRPRCSPVLCLHLRLLIPYDTTCTSIRLIRLFRKPSHLFFSSLKLHSFSQRTINCCSRNWSVTPISPTASSTPLHHSTKMCGIVGCHHVPDAKAFKPTALKMVKQCRHRGPDWSGSFMANNTSKLRSMMPLWW